MRLGRRCSLCGGRLDNSLRCTECGLDNTKNDAMYKHLINQNDCQDEPLTHVHEHKETYRAPKREQYDYKKYTANSKPAVKTVKRSTKSKNKSVVGKIISTIIVLSTIVPAIITIIGNLAFNVGIREEAIPERIESVMDYDYFLSPGMYKVGVHIPAGMYEVALQDRDYASMDIYDFDGDHLLMDDFWFFESEGEFYHMELLEGQYIVISEESPLCFEALETETFLEEGSILVESEESYYISGESGYMIAGQDFLAGVYDIYYTSESETEWGNVEIQILNSEGDTMWERFIYFDGYVGDTYVGDGFFANVPFTPGSKILVEENLSGVSLCPSYEISQEMYDITWGVAEDE